MPPPIGPEVDATPRPLPARVPLRGRYVVLEPLHRRHAAELWEAAQGADDSWAYLGCGPFASASAMARYVADFAVEQDRMVWAVRPVATGAVSGWLSLMDVQPKHASIELAASGLRRACSARARLPRRSFSCCGLRRMNWGIGGWCGSATR